MPDVTALFYIAIMAFYLLHKNEEAKILVPVIGFAAIPFLVTITGNGFSLVRH